MANFAGLYYSGNSCFPFNRSYLKNYKLIDYRGLELSMSVKYTEQSEF